MIERQIRMITLPVGLILYMISVVACGGKTTSGRTDQVHTETDTVVQDPGHPINPTETWLGEMHGEPILFQHENFTKYRLLKQGVVTLGHLNTERGFEEDEDATVFILNDDKPDNERIYLVRYSTNTMVILDEKSSPVEDVQLTRQ